MRERVRALGSTLTTAALLVACSSDPIGNGAHGAGGTNGSGGTSNGDVRPGDALTVAVSATRVTYVNLATPAVVTESDPQRSSDWDLAFVGYDVLTNGGLSGPGGGSAFGPLSISAFAFPDEPVDVPFLVRDRAGGALLDWYAYDGTTHTLYSRYHVYGVSSGGHLYKLQILGYYGDVQGAPASALYQLRYAEVTADGAGDTVTLQNVDATLGETPDGPAPSGDAAGPCVTLATGATTLLSPTDAAVTTDWDLCFRRDAVSVNGELGGPGDVAAADLDANPDEVLADVMTRTADSEQPAFDAVDYAALTSPNLAYRGDFVTSAFSDKWADLTASPPVPQPSTAFLVVAADGKSRFLVAFNAFEGADATTPGTVHLGVVPTVSP
jgi:hypothetical protein